MARMSEAGDPNAKENEARDRREPREAASTDPNQRDPDQRDPDQREAGPFDPMDDPMAPPREACECWCLHCRRTFVSSEMWFQRVIGARDGFTGFWMCPTHNCSGAGFGFDIYPTDPAHPANEGWIDDDDEDYTDDEEFDDVGEPLAEIPEWDPEEAKYKELDEEMIEDDDISGEEWKYGLEPGAEPPAPAWSDNARREWEEEQKRYDAPDERPRELDWTNRPERDQINDDDIPF